MNNLKRVLCGVWFFTLFTCAYPFTDVLFSPDDHPKYRLIEYITKAKKRFYAAVFTLTDKNIIDALVIAKQRGVDVQMVVDQTSVTSPYAKVLTLIKHDIPVFVFDAQLQASKKGTKTFTPLMHNKYAVIDGETVWTGSFNWTVSADARNQENVIITDDKKACKKYEEQFNVLLGRSHILTEKEATTSTETTTFKERSFWENPIENIQKWLTGAP